MKTITVNGTDQVVKELAFQTSHEGWSEYVLEDGTLVRVKVNISKTYMVLDDDGQSLLDQYGDPNIMISHSVQVVATKREGEG